MVFEDIKVGDKVMISSRLSAERVFVVKRVLKKSFTVENPYQPGKEIAYWMKDGRAVGDHDAWYVEYARLATDDDVKRVNDAKRTRFLLEFIKVKINKVSLAQLEDVYKIMRGE